MSIDLTKWRTQSDTGEWGHSKPLLKEMLEALSSMKQDGAPGIDLVTAQMLLMAGTSFHLVLLNFIHACWEMEAFPLQFFIDLVVPAFKRGDRYAPINYRPISLVVVAAKLFQKIIYRRINAWSCTQPHGGLPGNFQFGGIKGLDRLFLVWVIEAITILEFHSPQNGGYVFVLASDVHGAYPAMYQDFVSWRLRSKGVTGKIWRLADLMEKNLQATLRINGHFSPIGQFEDGGNQGTISSPNRWAYLIAALYESCVLHRLGLVVGGVRIPAVGFVDDATFLARSIADLIAQFEHREMIAEKLKFKWKPSKDQLLVRGPSPPKSCKIGDRTLVAEDSVCIVGEWISGTPASSPKQVASALKGMIAAKACISWLVWRDVSTDPRSAQRLFNSLVQSASLDLRTAH
jgi:hypothetical protein